MRHEQTKSSIVHVVHSLEGGGTERMLLSLLDALDRHGGRTLLDDAQTAHVVCTLRRAGALAARLPGHVPCLPLNSVGRCRLGGLHLARAIAPRRPAIIHARNTGCWADALAAGLILRWGTRFLPRRLTGWKADPTVGWKAGPTVILGFHGLESGGALTPKQRRLARWACKFGARFTSVSHTGKDQLVTQAAIDASHIQVIANGVAIDRFAGDATPCRNAVRRSLGFAAQDIVVGSVASLTPVKDHLTLLRAVSALRTTLPGVKLLLVGDGPERAGLESFARANGPTGSVTFTGWREDVPTLLSGMDVYVCSSRSEGMSNGVLEAMASGLPVVATEVGDNERLITDGRHGRLVTPGDVAALARILRQLIRARGMRRAYGYAARQRAHRFTLEAAVRRYEQYYRSVSPVKRQTPPGT